MKEKEPNRNPQTSPPYFPQELEEMKARLAAMEEEAQKLKDEARTPSATT